MKPLHTQISEYLIQKIESGEWPEGYKLPTEHELCQQLGVSRSSVRAAILPLVDEGHIKRVKGCGSFVTKPQKIDDTTIFIESFAEEMRGRGKEVVSEVLEFIKMKAETHVCDALQIPQGSSIIKLTRLRYCRDSMDSGPLALTTSYLNMKASFIQDYDMSVISLHRALEGHGLRRIRMEKHISAVLLDSRSCRLMDIPQNSLAILLRSYAWDNDGEILEYCESFYPTDRNDFILKIRG